MYSDLAIALRRKQISMTCDCSPTGRFQDLLRSLGSAVGRHAKPLLLAVGVTATVLPASAGPSMWHRFTLPPIYAHEMIYDTRENRLIVFGGSSYESDVEGYKYVTNPLQFDFDGDRTWRAMSPSGPQPPDPKTSWPMVYDPTGHRMLAYGSNILNQGLVPGELWALSLADPPSWRRVETGGAPLWGPFSPAVYDSARDRMVYFLTQPQESTSVWTLHLADSLYWERLPAANPPTHSTFLAAAFDGVRDRILLVEGGPNGPSRVRTWEFRLSTNEWSPLTTAGQPPWGQYFGNVEFDPISDRLIWICKAQFCYCERPYVLDLSANPPIWSEISVGAKRPPAADFADTVYDPIGHRVLFLGGSYAPNVHGDGSLWSLDLTDPPSWKDRVAAGPPSGVEQAAAAADFESRSWWIHGGTRFDTFEGSCQPRTTSARTFRVDLDDPSAWEEVLPLGTGPGQRSSHTAIFDAPGGRVILFGGVDSAGVAYGDVWSLTVSGTPFWSRLSPAGTGPPPLQEHSAVFDPSRRRMIVYGGLTGAPMNLESPDAWALDLTSDPPIWSKITVQFDFLPGRLAHTAVWDSAGDRMLVYGGRDRFLSAYSQVLALNFAESPPSWQLVTSISWIYDHVAGFDPLRRRMVVYDPLAPPENGHSGALVSDPPLSWTNLDPSGGPPVSERGAVAVFDPTRDRFLVYTGRVTRPGGYYGYSNYYYGGVWALEFDKSVPTRLSFVESSVENGVVRLRWWSPDGAQTRAEVERRDAGEDVWRNLGPIPRADASGWIDVEDRQVRPGGRYAYRLLTRDESGAIDYTPEVSVEVPGSGLRLAVKPFGANPAATNDWEVEVVLPNDAPATLEVFDVTGRRLARRILAGLGPGAHTVSLREIKAGAGLYHVRLTQGGEGAATRLIRVTGH